MANNKKPTAKKAPQTAAKKTDTAEKIAKKAEETVEAAAISADKPETAPEKPETRSFTEAEVNDMIAKAVEAATAKAYAEASAKTVPALKNLLLTQ